MHVCLTLFFCVILGVIVISVNGRQLSLNNPDDDDLYLTNSKARSFLDGLDGDDLMDLQRRACVGCKFGMLPCCHPNKCIKKTFRPDECMEIKTNK
ncbi:unnamed protein product [Didymodactylos carnosus]|uniref:Uncharacterized protein n=1 Tax=Didymodactylos carnosus TaxID=1234261 RepID=A0A815EL30_9BILA|nr:unnamed protein product [Didymodactylos carnosus]CAF1307968.1 unnamed protein product [Didymodactylos carnosus]CAF3999019.1 unnamed protein product [Didymodactylos carnosus]CAF4142810.1 unnamed protein product [Didymodactylos carnosus]